MLERLQAGLPWLRVSTAEQHGLPPLQVEAAAFAWLARRMLKRRPGNLPSVTGAAGLRGCECWGRFILFEAAWKLELSFCGIQLVMAT